MKLLVTNIQRFCLHDGPGIRTTVFLKGCSLHCPWCCNPENISYQPQFYCQKRKCIADNGVCPYGTCTFADQVVTPQKLMSLTSEDVERCKSGAIGIYGKWYTEGELYTELMKDAMFWGKEGGVTFSGGESLLQWDALRGLLERLKSSGTHLCVETSLFIPCEIVLKALELIDHWIVDIKLLDEERTKQVLGGDVTLYFRNLDAVAHSGRTVWLRHPRIKGYTDDKKTENAIQMLLQKYPSFVYQVLEGHHLGDEKYASLGKSVP